MKTGYEIGCAYAELKAWYMGNSSLSDVEGCLGATKPFLLELYFQAGLIDIRGFKEVDASFQDCFNVLLLYLFSGLLKRKDLQPIRKR